MITRIAARAGAIAALAVAVSACGQNSNSLTPGPGPNAGRGTVYSVSKTGVLSKKLMGSGLAGQIITALGGAPQCDVKIYLVRYQTIGVHGERADASAGMYVPDKGCKGPFPLIGYAHGTLFVRTQSMSHPGATHPGGTLPTKESGIVAAIYAAHGYVVAATDYLGMGLSSYPYHPYVHSDSEASAIVDAMRAARSVAATLHVPLSGKVFLNGYSQGGHSTLSAQRAIESENTGEFDLRGVAPASGFYAFEQSLIQYLRRTPGSPLLAAYVIPGYQKAYGNIYADPATVFQAPYAAGIDSLLPVATFGEEKALAGTTLPLSVSDLLQPQFLNSFLADPGNPLRVDARANSLLHGWDAKAPLYFCGGGHDPVVNFRNSREAYAYFKSHGGRVTLVDVDSLLPGGIPRSLYHDAVLVFCEPLARAKFFDRLK